MSKPPTFRPINIRFGQEKSASGPFLQKTDLAIKVEAALKNVNGTADAHTFTRATEIFDIAAEAELKLQNFGIAKKDRSGCIAWAVSGGSVPNAYKYTRKATWVQLERRSSGWWVTDIQPAEIYKEGGSQNLQLTKSQDEKAIANFRSQYLVAANI